MGGTQFPKFVAAVQTSPAFLVATWPGFGGFADVMDFSLRHHAFEAQSFVVSACGYLDRDAVPADFPASRPSAE